MDRNQAIVAIQGMQSEECVRLVAEVLLGVEGVDDVEVDLANASAVVTLNALSPASVDDLRQAVAEAGYSAGDIHMPVSTTT
jgi:copper chaperone CopZ